MEFPRIHQKSYETVQKSDPGSTKCDRPKIWKNLAALCAGTLMLFTAYDALTMLQSTMNRENGIGVISQATLYAFFCVSAILLPKLFISKFGSKNTSVAAMFAYLPYIASNYYPHWILMIPSSILLGIAGPLLWASHGVYLNGLSMLYSSHHKESIIEESVRYISAKKDARKKSGDDLTQKRSTVPNAVKDCVDLKHGESKEVSFSQSRKRLDSCDTCLIRSKSQNVVSDKLEYDKEASSLQPRKRQDSFWDVPMTRSHSSNMISGIPSTNKPSAGWLSSSGYHDLGSHQTNNTAVWPSSLEYTDFRSHQTDNSAVWPSSSEYSDLRSHQTNKSAIWPAFSKYPDFRSHQTDNNVVWPLFTEYPESGSHQNSNNDPLEWNSKYDETKRLVIKSTTTLLASTTAKFFGFHGMAHLTSHIWSSLLSYFTLKTDVLFVDFGNSSCRCGADFCSVVSECFEYNAGSPGTNVRTALTSICVCMCLVSILIVAVFLDTLEQEKRVVYFSFDSLNATCAILKRNEMLLLIPLSIHTGLVQGFYVGDFNKSYVACAWGTYHVGLVAVCYGVACGASSLLSGWCVRHCGRRPVFTASAVVNVVSVVFLLLWTPDGKFPKMFFFASALWGIHVGIVWSQLRAFYGVLFPLDEEAAFSAFHLWSGLGFCVAFGFSSFFCISHKLFAILVLSVLGFSGYYTVELIYCKVNKDSY